ncbi:MAG: phosphoglycerate kinase [SAR324 cluster bacterium]|nr:phosphoglycerate kinase [SAR324 cluster bacterium]MCH8887332.1 phosphoglycerate kinase [SAR324 cluster bacterium]
MGKLSVEALDVAKKTVLLRVDFNVPLENGAVADDTRIRAALPTIQYLTQAKAKVVLVSHLGRPKGSPKPELTLRPVAERLAELLEAPVAFCSQTVGQEAVEHAGKLPPGGVLLLENVRFYPEEEKNDPEFAASLARLAECFVSDAFGTVHRAHASTTGVAAHFPQAACGFLIARELEFLGQTLSRPKRPFVAVLGGAKVSDKIGVIQALLKRADTLLIGGAMAYTFLKAQGNPIGDSLLDAEHIDLAKTLLADAPRMGKSILMPIDHRVASEISPDASAEVCGRDIPDGKIGLDIGPKTALSYAQSIKRAKLIVWNGPMGMFELPAFEEGTMTVAEAMAESGGTTIIGGGDSVAAVNKAGLADRISHISTGGGASLKFLEGQKLPGIEALTDA